MSRPRLVRPVDTAADVRERLAVLHHLALPAACDPPLEVAHPNHPLVVFAEMWRSAGGWATHARTLAGIVTADDARLADAAETSVVELGLEDELSVVIRRRRRAVGY